MWGRGLGWFGIICPSPDIIATITIQIDITTAAKSYKKYKLPEKERKRN